MKKRHYNNGKLHLIITIIILVASIFSCKKNEVINPKTFIIVSEEIIIDSTFASIEGSYSFGVRLDNLYVKIRPSGINSDPQVFEASLNDSSFHVVLTNLIPSTLYDYWYVAKYSTGNEIITESKVFSTLEHSIAEYPIVYTIQVLETGKTNAIIKCKVEYDGGSDIIERGVCWSTDEVPSFNNEHSSNGLGVGEYVSEISNLQQETTYHVRAYARNNSGIGYGRIMTFTTQQTNFQMPIVETWSVSNITQTTANCLSEVIDNGGITLIERGICWSTDKYPTTSDYHISNGAALGTFSTTMTNLLEDTRYYVRAYAKNDIGVAYGREISFSTTSNGFEPTGVINGLFSVSSNQQVYFSSGNLQYQASTSTWRFANNQWDYIGDNNSNISETYNGWIDLFGWGTSGWYCGNTYCKPYDSDNSSGNLYGPFGLYDLTGTFANADWGVYNSIYNGGNTPNRWRTLTNNEWLYTLFFRNSSTINGVANARFVNATINNTKGIILFPDVYSHPSGIKIPVKINEMDNVGWNENVYFGEDFSKMEMAGVVFLPSGGYRIGASVEHPGSFGSYWSASYYGTYESFCLYFYDNYIGTQYKHRYYGKSVRLAQDNNFIPQSKYFPNPSL